MPEILSDMHDKLSQAVRLYDQLLTDQIAHRTRSPISPPSLQASTHVLYQPHFNPPNPMSTTYQSLPNDYSRFSTAAPQSRPHATDQSTLNVPRPTVPLIEGVDTTGQQELQYRRPPLQPLSTEQSRMTSTSLQLSSQPRPAQLASFINPMTVNIAQQVRSVGLDPRNSTLQPLPNFPVAPTSAPQTLQLLAPDLSAPSVSPQIHSNREAMLIDL